MFVINLEYMKVYDVLLIHYSIIAIYFRLKEKGGGWIMKHIYTFIKEDCQLGSKVEYCDVTRAFGVMQTNSMSICGLQGKAVYPTVSLMSHSCYNNLTVAAGPGEGVAFKAIRPIKRGDELTIR